MALRKEGKLDEAHKMAYSELLALRKAFDQASGPLPDVIEAKMLNDIAWGAKAYFWVEHDLCKKMLKEGRLDEAEKTLDTMKTLTNSFETDSVVDKAIETLSARLSYPLRDIFLASEASKVEGQAEKAFMTVNEIVKKKELPEDRHTDVAWIAHRAAREAIKRHHTQTAKEALALYLQLKVQKPSMLHSLILRDAIDLEKNDKNNFRFTSFLKMWGIENLSDGDWQPFITDKKNRLSSVVENTIYKYVAEVRDEKISDIPDDFVKLVDRAIEKFPRVPLLKYAKAKLLVALKRKEEAFKLLVSLTRTMSAPYVWQAIADIAPDREVELAALCKLLTLQRDRNLTVKVHLRLATLFAQDGLYAAAARELYTYADINRANRWNGNNDAYRRTASCVPPGTLPAQDNRDLYRQQAAKVDNLLYNDIPQVLMVCSGKFRKNKKGKNETTLYAANGTTAGITTNRLPPLARNSFNFFAVRIDGRNIVTIQPVDPGQAEPHFLTAEGVIEILTNKAGKHYAFLDDAYIPHHLLAGLPDNSRVRVVITQTNNRKTAAALLRLP